MIAYQIGGITFEIAPVTLQDVERETGADFVAKDIVGAQRPREAVGEADETLTFTALLFPFHFNGLDSLDVLDAMRSSQQPQPVMRGDGRYLGFYVIEKVRERSTELFHFGIGRKVEVTITLSKVPDVSDDVLSSFLSLF